MNFLLIALLVVALVELAAGKNTGKTAANEPEAGDTRHPAEFQIR